MNILVACDSFKGCMDSKTVNETIKNTILSVQPSWSVNTLTVADGGEGTVEALVEACNGQLRSCEVKDSYMNGIEATYGIIHQDTIVIEIANICGLPMVQDKNPYKTTTYGVGEIILHCLDLGYRKFIIGLGGSSTNDMGMGMLMALGATCLDNYKKTVSLGGIHLKDMCYFDDSTLDKRLKECSFTVASDVKNPLLGKNGASAIFGPQKGASIEMVSHLENAFQQALSCMGITYIDVEGDGAAGGMGFAFRHFLNAKQNSGIDLLLEQYGFQERLKSIDIIVTGEGKFDQQTLEGKVAWGIAKQAKLQNKKVIVVSPNIDIKSEHPYFDCVLPLISKPKTIEESIVEISKEIQFCIRNYIKLISLKESLK